MKKILLSLITITALGFGNVSQAQIPIEDLIFYTSFTGGNIEDATLNTYNETNNGSTATTDRFGNNNSAQSFAGTEYIHYEHTNGLSMYTRDFSISVWVKTTSTNRQSICRIGKYTGGTSENGRVALELNHPSGGGIYAVIGAANVNNSEFIAYNPTIADGSWHHLVFSRRGQSLYLYLDGVEVGNKFIGTYDVNNTNNRFIHVGSETSSSAFFDGSIDDIAVFSKALTPSEVSTINSATQSFEAKNLSAGLISKFDFDNSFAIDSLQEVQIIESTAVPTIDRNSNANSAMSFDAAQTTYPQSIRGNAGGAYNFHSENTGHLSISLWYRSSDPTSRQGLVNIGEYLGSSGSARLTMELHHPSGDSIRIIQSDGAGNVSILSANNVTVSDNQWHHIVYVEQSDACFLFFDGNLVADAQLSNKNIDGDKDFLLGSLLSGGSEIAYLSGAMDEVYIYNRGLHTPEITDLYTTGEFSYQPNTTSDLVFDVDFEGSFNDKTTYNALNANNSNVAVTGHDGNTAYSFDGIADYVQYKDSSILDLGSNEFTVSLWLNYTSTNRMIPFCIGKWNGGAGTENGKFYVELNPNSGEDIGARCFADDNSQSAALANTSAPINDGNWHHVAVTRDSHYMLIYVDGILEKRANVTNRNINNPNHRFLLLGANASPTPSTFYNGSIDDVKIYKNAMNSLDISELMNSTSGTVGVNELTSHENITVYPNPATSQLTIGIEEEIETITILDVTGKAVKTIATSSNTIDISNLVKGIYFLQVQTKKGISINKFIKE